MAGIRPRLKKLENARQEWQRSDPTPRLEPTPEEWQIIKDAEQRLIEAASIRDPVERERVEAAILAEFGLRRHGGDE
ncbi:MAG: hypothetical protein FJZ90_05135 [Chloroflexi bacterium]|nr:hypothetical protein [Chloroflexota bacterium]